MAGKTKEFLGGIFEKASPREQLGAELQASPLMYSVFGFVPATDGTDNVLLLSNLGYVLSQRGYNVCIVDFKVFSPNMYFYLDVEQNARGKGLLTALKDDKADLRDQINKTRIDNLFLLSPSPQDLVEEYFDFSIERVVELVETLKRLFDIVLIDIPNIPPLEFCLGAIKQCHIGYFTATERVDVLSNITRLLDFVSSLGVNVSKFTNVVFTNMQDVKFDINGLKKMRFHIAATIPYAKGALIDALEGRLYLRDNPLVSGQYKKEMGKLVAEILSQP